MHKITKYYIEVYDTPKNSITIKILKAWHITLENILLCGLVGYFLLILG